MPIERIRARGSEKFLGYDEFLLSSPRHSTTTSFMNKKKKKENKKIVEEKRKYSFRRKL